MNVKYLSTYLDFLFLLLVFYSFSHTDHVSILIDLYLNIPLSGAVVNGIVSLISISNYSLLVHKNFCIFIMTLCPATWLSSFIRSLALENKNQMHG